MALPTAGHAAEGVGGIAATAGRMPLEVRRQDGRVGVRETRFAPMAWISGKTSRRHWLASAPCRGFEPRGPAGAGGGASRYSVPDPEGPFYPHDPPLEADADLVRVGGRDTLAQGVITHLGGVVRDSRGRPVPDAQVEIWQCDANGRYHHPWDRRSAPLDENFQGYGRTRTGAAGRYRFRTIRPVAYPGRAPHIHFAIKGRSFEPLITQMYVRGAPENAYDGLLSRIGSPCPPASPGHPFRAAPRACRRADRALRHRPGSGLAGPRLVSLRPLRRRRFILLEPAQEKHPAPPHRGPRHCLQCIRSGALAGRLFTHHQAIHRHTRRHFHDPHAPALVREPPQTSGRVAEDLLPGCAPAARRAPLASGGSCRMAPSRWSSTNTRSDGSPNRPSVETHRPIPPVPFVAHSGAPHRAATIGSETRWPTTCFARSTPRIR